MIVLMIIPIKCILNNKISFWDIKGIKNCKSSIDEVNGLYYHDVDLENEVAIYGNFSSVVITYFDVDRLFQLIQKKAYDLGYPIGFGIPVNILYSERKYGDIVSR